MADNDKWETVDKSGKPMQLSKSQKKKQKNKTMDEAANEEALRGAGLVSKPLDVKPTMYQQFEEIVAQKEARKEAQASGKMEKKENVKPMGKKDKPKPTSSTNNQPKKDDKKPHDALIASLDLSSIELSADEARVSFPDHPIEILKSIADAVSTQLSSSVPYPASAPANAPLCYLPKDKKTALIKLLTSVDGAHLSEFFAICVRSFVDSCSNNASSAKVGMERSLLGMRLLIQLMIEMQVTVRKDVDIIASSVAPLLNHYKGLFPDEKVVLPLLYCYRAVSHVAPATYLRVWRSFHLPLLADKSSDTVKRAAVEDLKNIFPDDRKATLAKTEALKSVVTLSIRDFDLILKVTFAKGIPVPDDVRKELLRVFPSFRIFIVFSGNLPALFAALIRGARLPEGEAALQRQMLDLSLYCSAVNGECLSKLVDIHKKDPPVSYMFLRFLHEYGMDVKIPYSLANARPDQLATTVQDLKAANAELKAVSGTTANQLKFLAEVDTLLDNISQSATSAAALRKTMAAESEPSALSNFILTLLLLVSLFLLVILGAHLVCKFDLLSHVESVRSEVTSVCNFCEKNGVISGVDKFYDHLKPFEGHIEPVVMKTIEYYNIARTRAEPYVAPMIDAVAPHVGTVIAAVSPFVRQVADAVSPFASQLWGLILQGLAAAQPLVLSVYEAVAGFIAQMITLVTPHATRAWEVVHPYASQATEALIKALTSAQGAVEELVKKAFAK